VFYVAAAVITEKLEMLNVVARSRALFPLAAKRESLPISKHAIFLILGLK
jgi:hypothetical protein